MDPAAPAGPWWDEAGFWHGLHTLLDPLRVPFFRAALRSHPHLRRVLDVGSGAGFVAVGLADTAQVTAVDVSLAAVAEARAAGVPLAAAADGARLPFADAAFDAVICSEVLEHVANPAGTIAEAARVTVPGGLFLFSTPARTTWSRLALIEAPQRWRLTRVLPADLHDWNRFLTRSRLETLLAEVGFRIRRIAGIGIRPRHWPGMLGALTLLKLGCIGYAEAGKRIHLTLTDSTRFAMIGYAARAR